MLIFSATLNSLNFRSQHRDRDNNVAPAKPIYDLTKIKTDLQQKPLNETILLLTNKV